MGTFPLSVSSPPTLRAILQNYIHCEYKTLFYSRPDILLTNTNSTMSDKNSQFQKSLTQSLDKILNDLKQLLTPDQRNPPAAADVTIGMQTLKVAADTIWRMAETDKLYAETKRCQAETEKVVAEKERLVAERDKIKAYTEQLKAEIEKVKAQKK